MIFPRETKAVGNCIQIVTDASVRYRTLNYEGERWGAHRLSYHLNNGSITRKPPTPSTGLVLHKCDNKHCINPEHLYLGDSKQNMKDCSERSEGWKAWIESQNGKPKPESTKRKIAEAQRRHQQSKTPEQRKKDMAPVQAVANQYAQTPEAKAKRVASMRKYWDSLGPEGRRKHTRPAIKARGI